MAIQRLTAAYRSRSRPSSTPGAKASTMCPSYLDGDRRIRSPALPNAAGVVRLRSQLQCSGSSANGAAVIPVCWHGCAVFKVREEAHARTGRSVSQNSTAWGAAKAPPGPVDVSVAARARRRLALRRKRRSLGAGWRSSGGLRKKARGSPINVHDLFYNSRASSARQAGM